MSFETGVYDATKLEGWLDITPFGYRSLDVTPAMLSQWRSIGRRLATTNPFAMNGHNNFQNFVAGEGLHYKISDSKKRSTYKRTIDRAHDWWEQWVEDHAWQEKELEIIERADRDGEVLLRFFGTTPRFIDPDDIYDETGQYELGVVYNARDEQAILGFMIRNQGFVPLEETVFFKKNTDSDVHRGLPTFVPVSEMLERAKKLHRVVSKMVEAQASIAVVREHPEGTMGSKLGPMLDATATRTPKDQTGGSFRQKLIQPGSMLDVPPGQKYHFPIAGQSAENIQTVISLLLRAAGARVSQPEFMFSMDASRSNYASLIAAEQPGHKALQVTQSWFTRRFRKIFRLVIFQAVLTGQLPVSILDPSLKWSVRGPAVRSRDQFSITRSNEMKRKNGVLSRRTWAEQEGLDLDEEQRRMEQDGDPDESASALAAVRSRVQQPAPGNQGQ